jgi:hypothetical protein
MKKVVVFDVDKTLVNIADEYMVFINTTPRNWAAFQKHIPFDLEIPQTMWLLRSIMNEPDCTLIIATARPEECRQDTADYFDKRNIKYKQMYMRKSGDMRPDDFVKEELFAQIEKDHGEIFMAFEDRPHVAEMLIRKGIYVLEVGQQSEVPKWLKNKFEKVIADVLKDYMGSPTIVSRKILDAVIKTASNIDDAIYSTGTSEDKKS